MIFIAMILSSIGLLHNILGDPLTQNSLGSACKPIQLILKTAPPYPMHGIGIFLQKKLTTVLLSHAVL